MARKTRRSVPIENRVQTEKPTKLRLPRVHLGYVPLLFIVTVTIMVLVMITVPLRNYMEQRVEIARLDASISELQNRKTQIETDLEKYHSKEYIKEQARRRLGVIEPGETAFRIIDPDAETKNHTETPQATETTPAWYTTIWDSLTIPDNPEPEQSTPKNDKLPLQPLAPEDSAAE